MFNLLSSEYATYLRKKYIFMFIEIVAYSELAVRNNASVVEYCRTSMAALSGGTAGLLGLTGFYGFGFYVFAVIGLWVSCEFVNVTFKFLKIKGLFIPHLIVFCFGLISI
jgi:hypothetical protein